MIQILHSVLSVICNVDILCWLSVLRLQKVLQQVKMATQKRPWRWKTLRLLLTLKGNYWRQQQWTQLNDLALHEFSLDRAPAMCLGGYDSCRGLRFFLCPPLVSCWSIYLSCFITELNTYHSYCLLPTAFNSELVFFLFPEVSSVQV